MELSVHDRIRRGVRAAVYHACWRRLDGDDAGAEVVLATEVPAALAESPASPSADDPLVAAWIEQDLADFDRAVLISDLVARRTGRKTTALAHANPAAAVRVHEPVPNSGSNRPVGGGPLGIADMLDGMLAQDRKLRAAS